MVSRSGRFVVPRRGALQGSVVAVALAGAVALAIGLGMGEPPAATASGPGSGPVGCIDGNTVDGDCCSSGNIQEESRTGFTISTPGVVDSASAPCLNGGVNVCEDGADNDGDGLFDSEDPECTTLDTMQRQAVLATDPTARNGLRFGSEVRIAHRFDDGSTPDHDDLFLYGTCTAGTCTCPDTLVSGDPNDPNGPPLPRPGCEVAGRSCTTDADCEPLPYPHAQSHAGVCGANMQIRRECILEGNVAATGNVRIGRGFVESRNLVDFGASFFCDGCVERLSNATPSPHVRFDAEANWVGAGLCLPSAARNCYTDVDCCLDDGVTCNPPALPGDLCDARLQFDFLPTLDPNHNPYVVLDGGTLDPNDPNSPCNDYDRCRAAQVALALLRDDSGDPASLGVANLPGLSLTDPPAVFTADSVFIRGEQTERLTFSGGGTHVRNVDFINMRRAANLEIEAPADAVVVLRVLGSLRIGGENAITLVPPDPNDPADVLSPDNLLWILDGDRGAIFISRDVDLPGTVLAPRRRKIKLGGDTGVDGAVLGEEVDLRGGNQIRHRPFTPLLPTNLQITKTGVPDPQNPDAPIGQVVAGEDILYTIQVDNHGPSIAPGVVVTDVLPPEVTFNAVNITQGNGSCEYVASAHTVLCFLGTLGREDDPLTLVLDDEATIEIEVTTLADTRGIITNNFEVHGNIEQSVPGNNQGTEDTTVIGISDLNVISKVDAPDPSIAGLASALTYTIQIENLGPSDAFEADPPGVQLTDIVPNNLTIVSATHQPGDGGAPQPCTVLGQTVVCDMGRVDVINTQPNGTEPNPEVVTIVVTPDCDAHNTHPPMSPLSNTATVSNAGELDPVPGNDSANATTGFLGEVDLSSTKTDSVNPTPGYVLAGQQMNYTIQVANGGPSDATSVVISDTLPAGLSFASGTNCSATGGTPFVNQQVTCNIASIGCNSNASRTFTVNTQASIVEGTTVTNNVTGLAQNETEIGAGDETTSRNTLVRRRSNLAISKTRTSPVGNCVPGQTVSYSLVVTNAGPSNSTGATVTDNFPSSLSGCSWTCASSGTASCPAAGAGNINASVDIAAGGGNSVTFSVTCNIDPSARGTLANTATVTKQAGTVDDPNLGNNTSTNNCTLAPSANLSLSQTDAGTDPALAGTPSGIVRILTIDNAGPSDAINGSGVVLTDTLPAGTSFVSAVHSGGGSCSHSSGVVTCNLGSILVADAAETVTITSTPACSTRTSVTHNAQVVTGGEADPGTPNASSEGTTITEDVNLAISKIGSPSAIEENVDLLTYTITVDNNAVRSCALNTTVSDTLDSDLQSITVTPSQGGCSSFPCNLGTINAGTSATITVTATAANGSGVQNDATFNEVTNVASVDSAEAQGPQVSAPTVTTDVRRNNNDLCTLATDCDSGLCECANANCTTRRCSAVACPCQFNTNGNGTCDGNLNNGLDPGNACGTCAACSGGACADHAANTDPESECGFCQSCDGSGACGTTANSFDPHDDCPVGAADCCNGAAACGGTTCSE